MPLSRQIEKVYRFGVFEFRPETQELFKDGVRIRVQTKPLQILRTLIERPGELISREELRRELWADGTFVDFESGLNSATNRLRVALNDSADDPRYIETVPRFGYRFICPVTQADRSELVRPTQALNTHGVNASSQPELPIPSKRIDGKLAYASVAFAGIVTFVGVVIYTRSHSLHSPVQPSFHPLTYRPEAISAARFLPGAKSAVYTAYSSRDGTRTMRLEFGDDKGTPVPVSSGELLSVSTTGKLLLRDSTGERGGHAIEIARSGQKDESDVGSVRSVDWLPNGKTKAAVRVVGTEYAIEYPIGHVAYRSTGWLNNLRVSPSGSQVAFLEHPVRDDDGGHVRVVDKDGNTRKLTDDFNSVMGLSWSPSGREVLFTASRAAVARSLYAVSTGGVLHRLSNAPPSLRLFDIAPDGRALVTVDDFRGLMLAQFPGTGIETDVSQFDQPNPAAMSADGSRVLFTEAGDAGGQHYKTMLLDGSKHSSRIVGSGRAMSLSSDAQYALLLDRQDDTFLTLVSLRDGSSRRISGSGLHYQWGRFLGSDILAGAAYSGGPLMLFRESVEGESGGPIALAGLPYIDYVAVAPDGCKAIGRSGPDFLLLNVCDKEVRALPIAETAVPAGWSRDSDSFAFAMVSKTAIKLMKFYIRTSSVLEWKQLQIPEPTSSSELTGITAAPDTGAYVYSVEQQLSRLYFVDGWLTDHSAVPN
jgi:DNA-binding winged helix-turn-helix (wHTH) protein/WD40 repeat protein